jgi:hypothetical protein
MLRFAARYGFGVDRTLALTAAHLSMGRLLSPPSNIKWPHGLPADAPRQAVLTLACPAVATRAGFAAEADGSGEDPREARTPELEHLEAGVITDTARQALGRREMLLTAFEGTVATCAPRCG